MLFLLPSTSLHRLVGRPRLLSQPSLCSHLWIFIRPPTAGAILHAPRSPPLKDVTWDLTDASTVGTSPSTSPPDRLLDFLPTHCQGALRLIFATTPLPSVPTCSSAPFLASLLLLDPRRPRCTNTHYTTTSRPCHSPFFSTSPHRRPSSTGGSLCSGDVPLLAPPLVGTFNSMPLLRHGN